MPADTAIDLSLVPSPAVIEALDFDTLLAEMKAKLLEYLPGFDTEDMNDPAVHVLHVAAYFRLLDRQRVNDASRAVMVAYAVGSDLDNLGALFRVVRFDGESDSDFRERIVLAPDGYSVAGPAGAYVYLARSADARVRDATVASPSPGEVVVTVMSSEATGTASGGLLTVVNTALNADTVRPLTDHVTVQSATEVNFTVTASIYTYAGPDKDVVMAEANAGLVAYLASVKRLGRDITLSGLYGALHVAGVQRVVLASPTAIVAISDTQVGTCTAITVTWAGTDS